MAAKLPSFTAEEMSIDPNLGYPKAYSKLCSSFNSNTRSYSTIPYSIGPPLSFLPYTLQPHEALRAKDLNQLFPIIDPDTAPTTNPRGYVNLLWKQLDHLGNAGFDPALFRVDPYGNVLYLHADSASPLAWDIDHWFPCSRGGRTVPGNLRLLQWQVCKKKKNKLEFLVPWWDLQLGISVNQFLSIFASQNSDFRNRAFSFMFSDGGGEELNALQTVESHSFPQHFIDTEQHVGLAPAAIVSMQRNSDPSVLKPLDINKSLRHNSPFPGIKKFTSTEDEAALNMAIQRYRPSKENEQPESDDFSTNPYLSITRARDSLRQREECKKKEAEMSQLEDEVNELRQKNEAERVALQDLEALLIKRRRRAEKCRRLAEAQASYKALLEKMIRDAMHQSVVYKEQLRLNQAATSALMARLEAQRATCDDSENELRRKYNQRDELEKKVRPCWEEQARKRSRMDYTMFEETNEDLIKGWTPLKEETNEDLIKGWTPLKKELRVLLDEEEQRESKDGLSHIIKDENLIRSRMQNDGELKKLKFREGSCSSKANNENLLSHKLERLVIRDGNEIRKEEKEEDEEQRKEAGKGNVEKWLQTMLENAKEGSSSSSVTSPEKDTDRLEDVSTAKTIDKLNQINPEKEIKYLKLKPLDDRRRTSTGRSRKSFEVQQRDESKERFERCESSSRGFRSMPSSPLNSVTSSSSKFIKNCTKTIKRAVNK